MVQIRRLTDSKYQELVINERDEGRVIDVEQKLSSHEFESKDGFSSASGSVDPDLTVSDWLQMFLSQVYTFNPLGWVTARSLAKEVRVAFKNTVNDSELADALSILQARGVVEFGYFSMIDCYRRIRPNGDYPAMIRDFQLVVAYIIWPLLKADESKRLNIQELNEKLGLPVGFINNHLKILVKLGVIRYEDGLYSRGNNSRVAVYSTKSHVPLAGTLVDLNHPKYPEGASLDDFIEAFVDKIVAVPKSQRGRATLFDHPRAGLVKASSLLSRSGSRNTVLRRRLTDHTESPTNGTGLDPTFEVGSTERVTSKPDTSVVEIGETALKVLPQALTQFRKYLNGLLLDDKELMLLEGLILNLQDAKDLAVRILSAESGVTAKQIATAGEGLPKLTAAISKEKRRVENHDRAQRQLLLLDAFEAEFQELISEFINLEVNTQSK